MRTVLQVNTHTGLLTGEIKNRGELLFMPGATHFRGELIDQVPGHPADCVVMGDAEGWTAERTKEWEDRVKKDYHFFEKDMLYRGCSRNRGGPGPADFKSLEDMIRRGIAQWAENANPGDVLELPDGSIKMAPIHWMDVAAEITQLTEGWDKLPAEDLERLKQDAAGGKLPVRKIRPATQ